MGYAVRGALRCQYHQQLGPNQHSQKEMAQDAMNWEYPQKEARRVLETSFTKLLLLVGFHSNLKRTMHGTPPFVLFLDFSNVICHSLRSAHPAHLCGIPGLVSELWKSKVDLSKFLWSSFCGFDRSSHILSSSLPLLPPPPTEPLQGLTGSHLEIMKLIGPAHRPVFL